MSKAPRLVYFDRSAWADLVRDQDAGGDTTDRLRRAVTANRVKIAISDPVVDETVVCANSSSLRAAGIPWSGAFATS